MKTLRGVLDGRHIRQLGCKVLPDAVTRELFAEGNKNPVLGSPREKFAQIRFALADGHVEIRGAKAHQRLLAVETDRSGEQVQMIHRVRWTGERELNLQQGYLLTDQP